MKLVAFVAVLVAAGTPVGAFSFSSSSSSKLRNTALLSLAEKSVAEHLTEDIISKLPFRKLQEECQALDLETDGTTADLRSRLRHATGTHPRSSSQDDTQTVVDTHVPGVNFVDESDPDFDYKQLLQEALQKASVGHWKAATRKLKRIKRRFEKPIPPEAYLATLQACAADRLHGARASEPARKILEDMVVEGYDIPSELANSCIQNCIGEGQDGTHDGFGGTDTALAMISALEQSQIVTEESYSKVLNALARSNDDHAVTLLRSVVVDQSLTLPLYAFADVAVAASKQGEAETVLNVLAYAKAAGYQLDNIASVKDGITLLACGLISAEKLNNAALGLRFLAAASKASGCAPDRGDDLVCSSSSAAQRAATLIHKQAIKEAVENGGWRLAVKLLQLMMERSLTPSPAVWRNVVACCAKADKSRKATALLLDWVKLSEAGRAEKPPLSVFNTCINVCEKCDEHDLTLVVLDSMKKTHNTEGNLITFNIALKRLARLGDTRSCEGIIIGMLQSGIEPSVVSYTTAIASCVTGTKNAQYAYEWIKRMRARNVQPNVITYNTALAACLDGKFQSTELGIQLAKEMLADVEKQLAAGVDMENDEYTNVIPDVYTKSLARKLMKQLKQNWNDADVDRSFAKTTLRPNLLKLVEFQKSEAAVAAKKLADEKAALLREKDADSAQATGEVEVELEFSAAASAAARTAEV